MAARSSARRAASPADAPRWLTPPQERAWRAYRRMNRLLYARLEAELVRDSGLSDADYEVLSNLTESATRAWRFRELSRRLQWSSSRLSHQLSRMEARGLVRRKDCDDDGRGATIHLTAGGWRAIQRAAPGHVAGVRRHFIDALSPKQLAALEAAATTVVQRLAAT